MTRTKRMRVAAEPVPTASTVENLQLPQSPEPAILLYSSMH